MATREEVNAMHVRVCMTYISQFSMHVCVCMTYIVCTCVFVLLTYIGQFSMHVVSVLFEDGFLQQGDGLVIALLDQM